MSRIKAQFWLPRRFLQRIDGPSPEPVQDNSFVDDVIVVGAPVFERGWILDDWFRHLSEQVGVSTKRLHILLNYGAGQDNTLEIIYDWQGKRQWAGFEIFHDEGKDHSPDRKWKISRYETLVRLRNRLLSRVRELGARHYLTCDTDMLLPPETISTLLRDTHLAPGYDGIAPLAYMTPTEQQWPNVMDYGLVRRPILLGGVQQVGACFGVVLMNERLILVDYEVHPNGEDLGWARRATQANLRLAVTTDVVAKHVMTPDALRRVDWRVGF